jgi:hypothetical protein
MREECRLRVFQNWVLRRIFGPKREEVMGVEKTTQQGALCFVLLTTYHSSNQVKKPEIGRTCTGEMSDVYRVLVRKPEERRPLAKPRNRWEDNIKMAQDVGWGNMDWIDLVQDRDRWQALENAVIYLLVL